MKNGLNFGQFLETILVRAYQKVDKEDRTKDPDAYSEILQEIFQNGIQEIKDQASQNELNAELYSA